MLLFSTTQQTSPLQDDFYSPDEKAPPRPSQEPVQRVQLVFYGREKTFVVGFGTTALESLPGRIGTQDVADVVAATKAALALEPEALDPSKVGVVGGSHGGFLGAHLTAQHPEIFKVAALRNPVSSVPKMGHGVFR